MAKFRIKVAATVTVDITEEQLVEQMASWRFHGDIKNDDDRAAAAEWVAYQGPEMDLRNADFDSDDVNCMYECKEG